MKLTFRIGKKGMVTIKTEKLPDVVADGTASGTYAVFNLDMARTEFHVGGVPEDFGVKYKAIIFLF